MKEINEDFPGGEKSLICTQHTLRLMAPSPVVLGLVLLSDFVSPDFRLWLLSRQSNTPTWTLNDS
jgi:hypothetical protein